MVDELESPIEFDVWREDREVKELLEELGDGD